MAAETFSSILARKGLTLADLERETRIRYQTFCRWKTGEVPPSPALLRLCAMVLDLPEERLRKAIAREAKT